MVTAVMQGVMSVDALRSSRPISIPVRTSEDVGQVFDKIAYEKGETLEYIQVGVGCENDKCGISYIKKDAGTI